MNWSYPPHDFNAADYIGDYTTFYAIGVKVFLSDLSQKEDAVDYYYRCRHLINRRLLEYEKEVPDFLALIGGHCELCDKCTRGVLAKCTYPDNKRYSLESLGFKVSGVIEDFFDDKQQWDKGKKPGSLYIGLGLLSNTAIDVGRLRGITIQEEVK